MPRLYEYQAKKLFEKHKVNIPSGIVIDSIKKAENAHNTIGASKVVLKAQVKKGKRGKEGLIEFSSSATETEEKTKKIINRIVEQYSEKSILVEEAIDFKEEMYISIFSDSHTRKPVVMFSLKGGVDVEELSISEDIYYFNLDIGKPYYLFNALNDMRKIKNLNSKLLNMLAGLLVKLYMIYLEYDCNLVEINPLVVGEKGLIALDGKISVDDDALFRQKELGFDQHSEIGIRKPTLLELCAGTIDEGDHRGSAHFVQIDPDGLESFEQGLTPIGFNSVGTGAALTTMDELIPMGYNPINFCDTSGNPPASKLYRVTKLIFSQPHIKGYLMVSCVSSQQLDNTARGIVKALLELYPETEGKPNVPCVFAFRGALDKEARRVFEEFGITDSPHVLFLERDWTEKDAVEAFHKLYSDFYKA